MIHRKFLMATAIIASVVTIACSDTTAPDQLVPADLSSGRSGTFHVDKECREYTGQAGDFCTIESSTLKAIKAGSRVIYAEAAAANGLLDTRVVLDTPGRGKSKAFGRCKIDLGTGTGQCDFSGGTGTFKGFRAHVEVLPLGDLRFEWNGTYSFSRDDDD
jgi:hypothetical protein